MQLTKERKILISVLGLGLTALAADRVFLLQTSPQETAAAPKALDNTSEILSPNTSSTTNQTGLDTSSTLAPTVAIADKLSAFGTSPPSNRDLTQIPAMWQPSKKSESEPVIQHLSFKQFEAEGHTVQGIVWEQSEPVVMVDGRALRVGDQIDGFRIAAIGERSLSLSPLPPSHTDSQKAIREKHDSLLSQ